MEHQEPPPARHYPKDSAGFYEPQAASAPPPPEPQGQQERSGLATGSLPVSSVLDLAARYESMANGLEECGAHFMAATYRDIALDIRAVAGRATQRQLEENVQGEPRL